MLYDNTIHRDANGGYRITFVYTEPDDGKSYVFKTYINSAKIKSLGGRFSIFCEDDGREKFYRSEYLRDRAYSKFVRDGLSDG